VMTFLDGPNSPAHAEALTEQLTKIILIVLVVIFGPWLLRKIQQAIKKPPGQ